MFGKLCLEKQPISQCVQRGLHIIRSDYRHHMEWRGGEGGKHNSPVIKDKVAVLIHFSLKLIFLMRGFPSQAYKNTLVNVFPL